MIEINLLPKELRKKQTKRTTIVLSSIPVQPIIISVIASLFVLGLILSLAAYSRNCYLKKLEVRWNEMTPQREKTEKIAEEITLLGVKNTVISKIAKPEVVWSELLSGLNEAMTPNIWLSNLSLDLTASSDKKRKEGDDIIYLDISGFALGRSEEATPRVAKFIASLKRNKNFSKYVEEIQLENIKGQVIVGEEVMAFDLACKLKIKRQLPPEETKAKQGVPTKTTDKAKKK
ncbi:MAG: hypothetical protein PHW46_05005 [Candidatus Omnitrophica bacterium]|nr:hypothetical protein [Candidatus Omnitrophota bacterium]